MSFAFTFFVAATDIIAVSQAASCNYYLMAGLAVGECQRVYYKEFADEIYSSRYDCINSTHLRIRGWNTSTSCSGDESFDGILGNDENIEFDCNAGDSGCSLMELSVSFYNDSDDCSSTKISGSTFSAYYVNSDVDCQIDNDASDNEYYSRRSSVSQGIFYTVYNDANCTDIWYNSSKTPKCVNSTQWLFSSVSATTTTGLSSIASDAATATTESSFSNDNATTKTKFSFITLAVLVAIKSFYNNY